MTPQAALFAGLIDYAGLFPPAALEMEAAVRQYAEHRSGPHAEMLGRFIVPLARLAEMRKAAAPIGGSAEWKLSVLALPGEPLPPEIDSVELKIERAEDIRRLSSGQGGRLPALRYFEIPIASDPGELIAALAESSGRAKVRTGGATVEAFPGAAELARFLCECATARVPFKATAGLHHPLPSLPMHGFVNLFLAAAFAYHGGSQSEVLTTLLESSADAFEWDFDGVGWHGHRLAVAEILSARAKFAIAFGSCSFEEPVAGLQALGWL